MSSNEVIIEEIKKLNTSGARRDYKIVAQIIMLARQLDLPSMEEKLKHVSRCTNIKYAYLDFWNRGKNTWGNHWGLLYDLLCNPEPCDRVVDDGKELPLPPKIETKNLVKITRGEKNELILTNIQITTTTETITPSSERYTQLVETLIRNFKENVSLDSISYRDFLDVLLIAVPKHE